MPASRRSIRCFATNHPECERHDLKDRRPLNNIGGIETTGLDFNFDLSLDETGIGASAFS